MSGDRHSSKRWSFGAGAGICLALALVTFLAYRRVTGFDFIGVDDSLYVTANPWVRGGFTMRGLVWAVASLQPDYWFPLTRLSHLFDYSVFGPSGPWHHTVSIAIHIAASILLFDFLNRATRQRWPSAFVAAVFALHPMHVESVAWVSERKDVLCAFFWFAALGAWVRYAERPTRRGYAAALILFAAGLMSKPMIVTFPLLLVVLDVWPLRRTFSRQLVVEKLPFLLLAAAVAPLAYVAQNAVGAVRSLDSIPLLARLENAAITVFVYIGKTVWPTGLSFAYPWPASEPGWRAALAGLALTAISVILFRRRRDFPWLAAGWFWFLITLLPVIGIVQVGAQSRADHFMYVPMTGLLIAVAWGGAALVARNPRFTRVAAAAAGIVCVALAVLTWRQTQYWENAETLFRHAIAENPRNELAWEYLAETLKGRPGAEAEEISCYRRALRIRPGFPEAGENLGWALYRAGRTPEAIGQYRGLLRLRPDLAQAHCDLGSILLATGQTGQAIAELEAAVRDQPASAEFHNNLAAALWRQGGVSKPVIDQLQRAIALRPAYPLAHTNLGLALLGIPDQASEAAWHFNQALLMDPRDVAAHLGLAGALAKIPFSEAEGDAHLSAAISLQPDAGKRRLLQGLRTDDGTAQ